MEYGFSNQLKIKSNTIYGKEVEDRLVKVEIGNPV